jgi:hypothetical protein
MVGLSTAVSPLLPVASARTSLVQPGDSMTPATRARELNRSGQQRFDQGDYAGAAADWSRILEILPENEVNREERENALLISLEGYRQAYEKRRTAPGDNAMKEAVDFLRRAVIVLDTYVMEFERAYGKGAIIGPDAAQAGDEIRALLADAEGKLQPEPPPPRVEKQPETPIFQPTNVDRGPSGTGLIVAGSICIALGLGSVGMIVGGVVVARRAKKDRATARGAMPPDVDGQNDANRRIANVANPLIISGAVLTGAFMVAGFTMLGIGIRRRIRYMAIAPSVGPRYTGLSLTSRF